MMKKILLSPWTALITLLMLSCVRLLDPSFVESVRLRYFDTLITSRPATQNNIYTVNIDEATLDQHGQWPFRRDIYGELIKEIYKRNAGLVVLNVLMSEPDRFNGDAALAQVMLKNNVVLTNVPAARNKNTAKKTGAAIINPEHLDQVVGYGGVIANIKLLEDAAVGVGIVNTLPEIDGVNRRMPLVVSVQNTLYPNVALETLRVMAGDPSFQIKLNALGVEKMRIPKFGAIQTDNLGRIWIDWSQGFKSVSAVNLPADFAGAVVVIGPTAAGIGNPVPTARGAVWPHEVQATVIGTVASGTNIIRASYADAAETLALIMAGIILICLTRWMYVGMGAVVVLAAAGLGGSYYVYHDSLILFDATMFTGSIVVVALHAYMIKFLSEYFQKQQIKKQFAGYASPTVVRMLQENPKLIKEGMKREVSICFSDLRGFTPLGESFGDDVKGLTKIMNGYMDAITQPILDADGMVIKYIGDASMHIHNAPLEDPNHPRSAVRTGLNMLKAVEKFNDKIVAEGRPPIGMGAGINTGLGYIGEMGSTIKHSYDVLGDAVSTAARIESKCKEYGCLLLIGGATVERCKDDFFFLKIDDLAVKGKTIGIAIYTVLDDVTSEYTRARNEHERMHSQYRAQKFKSAINICKELKDEFDGKMNKYYDMWIERCEFQLTQDLPKDWDGVFIATSK